MAHLKFSVLPGMAEESRATCAVSGVSMANVFAGFITEYTKRAESARAILESVSILQGIF